MAARAIGAPKWIATNFGGFGGIYIPEAGASITAGHCVAGLVYCSRQLPPVAKCTQSEERRDCIYVPINSHVFATKTLFVARDYFFGGLDIAVAFDAPPKCVESSFQRLAELLAAMSEAPEAVDDDRRLVVLGGDTRPNGLGCFIPGEEFRGYSHTSLTDVGFPGLSGSAVRLTHSSKLYGMYTARVPSTQYDARESKTDGVITSVLGGSKWLLPAATKLSAVEIPAGCERSGDSAQRRMWMVSLAQEMQSSMSEELHSFLFEATGFKAKTESEASESAVPTTVAAPVEREVAAGGAVKATPLPVAPAEPTLAALFELIIDTNRELREDMNRNMSVINANHNDLLRRRSIVLPLGHVFSKRPPFERWNRGVNCCFARGASRVHAFDSNTDCDYGLA